MPPPLRRALLTPGSAWLWARRYRKAVLFGDHETADQILLEPKPSAQKALGRKVKGFDDGKWIAKREEIVEEGNWWKFTRPRGDLRKMLLETGDRLLVEASPYDRIWGVGYGAADAVSAPFPSNVHQSYSGGKPYLGTKMFIMLPILVIQQESFSLHNPL